VARPAAPTLTPLWVVPLRLLREAGLIRLVPSPFEGRACMYGIHPGSRGRITAWLAGTGIGLEDRL